MEGLNVDRLVTVIANSRVEQKNGVLQVELPDNFKLSTLFKMDPKVAIVEHRDATIKYELSQEDSEYIYDVMKKRYQETGKRNELVFLTKLNQALASGIRLEAVS